MERSQTEKLALFRRLMFGAAGFNLVMGLVGLTSSGSLVRAFGFDRGLYLLGWGLAYGAFALFLPSRPYRGLIGVTFLFLAEGAMFVWAAQDRGAGWPLAGSLLRVACFVLLLLGFSAARGARQEAADAALRARRPFRARTFAKPAGSQAEHTGRVLDEQERRRRAEAGVRPLVGTAQARAGVPSLAGVTTKVDAAADLLRWVARRLVVNEQGLLASDAKQGELKLAYGEIQGLCVRRLPAEPPWDGQLLMEIIPAASLLPAPVVRVFSTTRLSLPAELGPVPTARLDLVRRLGALITERAPSASMDEATARFVREGAPPARLASAKELAEHDGRYA